MGTPLLNPEMIATLRELEAESTGFLDELLAIYRSQAPAYLAEIRRGMLAGDVKVARSAAHTLKGSVANLGAADVAKLASTFESESAAVDWELRLARLEKEVARVGEAFAEIVAASRPASRAG